LKHDKKVNKDETVFEKFGDDPAKRPSPGKEVKMKGENYEKVRRPTLLINHIRA
jgi:hypothetical protein